MLAVGAKKRLYGAFTQILAYLGEVMGKTPKMDHFVTPKIGGNCRLSPYDLYILYAVVLSERSQEKLQNRIPRSLD